MANDQSAVIAQAGGRGQSRRKSRRGSGEEVGGVRSQEVGGLRAEEVGRVRGREKVGRVRGREKVGGVRAGEQLLSGMTP